MAERGGFEPIYGVIIGYHALSSNTLKLLEFQRLTLQSVEIAQVALEPLFAISATFLPPKRKDGA